MTSLFNLWLYDSQSCDSHPVLRKLNTVECCSIKTKKTNRVFLICVMRNQVLSHLFSAHVLESTRVVGGSLDLAVCEAFRASSISAPTYNDLRGRLFCGLGLCCWDFVCWDFWINVAVETLRAGGPTNRPLAAKRQGQNEMVVGDADHHRDRNVSSFTPRVPNPSITIYPSFWIGLHKIMTIAFFYGKGKRKKMHTEVVYTATKM